MKDVNNLIEHLKRIEVYRISGSDGPMMASVSEETLVRTIAGIEQLVRERDGARKALDYLMSDPAVPPVALHRTRELMQHYKDPTHG